jgi:hypothetical protein
MIFLMNKLLSGERIKRDVSSTETEGKEVTEPAYVSKINNFEKTARYNHENVAIDKEHNLWRDAESPPWIDG